MLKLLIAGGRDYTDENTALNLIAELIEKKTLPDEFEVVHGGARGADRIGHIVGLITEQQIHRFLPDWDNLGRSAGYVRNAEMGKFADMLIAFWDGKSRGTAHMIQYMKSAGKPVIIVPYTRTTIRIDNKNYDEFTYGELEVYK